MMKVRILDRYILGEMLPPFILSLAVLLLVLILNQLFQLADLVVSKGATLLSTVKMLALILPSFLVISIPMSFLVASLTTFSRMSADSEITAMKASRISLYSLIRPSFLFALLSFCVTAFTSLVLVPSANVALKSQLFDMVKSQVLLGVEPGVFSSTFNGMVIYVDKMDAQNNMDGVFIYDERAAKEPYAIVAKRGKLIADPDSLNVTLAMQDGSINTQPRNETTYNLMHFGAARLFLDIKSTLAKRGPELSFQEMSSIELLQDIAQSHREGKPAYPQETELHKRLSIPYACLIFGLIGAPLGIRKSRSGKSAGIAIAVFAFLVYYIILGSAANLAVTGRVPALQAFWIPNILLTLAAVVFVFKKGQEVNFMIGNRMALIFFRLKMRIRNWTAGRKS